MASNGLCYELLLVSQFHTLVVFRWKQSKASFTTTTLQDSNDLDFVFSINTQTNSIILRLLILSLTGTPLML
jgi:hypothetical protein